MFSNQMERGESASDHNSNNMTPFGGAEFYEWCRERLATTPSS